MEDFTKMQSLKKFFKIEERKSTVTKEVLGGVVTFLAMVYILPVNADMLNKTGMSFAAVFAATALAAALASILMGMLANYPIALASGMGVNAFFTYTVVFGLGYTWQEALAAVLISGVLFLIISVTGVRKKVINAIPKDLKLAVGAGIGFFIAFIGLKNAGIIVGNPGTLVSLGDFSHPTVLLGLFGIILVFILLAINKKISRFAIIISILATAFVGVLVGLIFPNTLMPTFGGTNLGGIGDIKETFGQAIVNIPTLFAGKSFSEVILVVVVIFTFLFVDFFDTAGTLVAVGHDAGLLDEKGELINGEKALLADAIGTVAGATLGTSTVTSYIESSAGVKSGARTGLSAVTVGVLFLVSLVFYPLFSVVGGIEVVPAVFENGIKISDGVFFSPVTSLALVYVGALMVKSLKDINWNDGIVVGSTFITILMMVLSFSIAEGIAFGFTFYTLMMLFTSRRKEVSPVMYVLTILFILNFVLKYAFLV